MFHLTNVTDKERRAFTLHLIYSIIDGILFGILALNEFILIKSLAGSDYQVGFLFQLSMVVLIFSILFNELIKRTARKKRFLNIFVILTRLPLLFVLFLPNNTQEINTLHQYIFLGVLLIFYFSNPIIFPMINLFLKQTYSHQNFGRLYSISSSVGKISAVISTFLAGIILDVNQFYFKYLYVFLAFGGIVAIFILTKIDFEDTTPVVKVKFFTSVKNSLVRMKDILIINKPFLHFEIGFMFYGLAFMMTSGVIPLFLNNVLELNYSSLAFYKNGYNVVNILLLPVFGKIIGKLDPRKFAIITFSMLALFLIFLSLTSFFDGYFVLWNIKIYSSLLLAYLFFGIFSASMGLLWSIGSAYFSRSSETADYQSVHLSLTGVRGVFAPIIGIYFYVLMGYNGVFLLSVASLAVSVGVNFFSLRKMSLEASPDK